MAWILWSSRLQIQNAGWHFSSFENHLQSQAEISPWRQDCLEKTVAKSGPKKGQLRVSETKHLKATGRYPRKFGRAMAELIRSTVANHSRPTLTLIGVTIDRMRSGCQKTLSFLVTSLHVSIRYLARTLFLISSHCNCTSLSTIFQLTIGLI